MRRIVCLAMSVVFIASLLSGCAETTQAVREHPRTTVGAGAGVVGGAVVGGLIGGQRGAVIGGLLGGLTGGVIGHYMDQQEKTAAETRQAYAYKPDQGTRLKIEEVRANPGVVEPGETINIHVIYAVLTRQDSTMIPIKETREILSNGRTVGKASVDLEREGGTWRSTVPITLPDNAAPGKYTVVASIESQGGGKDIRKATFKVQNR